MVVDEVVGQWITLAGAATLNWKSWLLALLLFRAVRYLEAAAGAAAGTIARRRASWSTTSMAGVYGALVLFAAGWFNLY